MFPSDTKILICDDFSAVRVAMKVMLKEYGYNSVFMAENGLEALEKLREAASTENPFGLVLCDWSMPKMDGLELLKACRSDSLLQKLAIILVTVEKDIVKVKAALSEGATDYLLKPVSAESLKLKLARAHSNWTKLINIA